MGFYLIVWQFQWQFLAWDLLLEATTQTSVYRYIKLLHIDTSYQHQLTEITQGIPFKQTPHGTPKFEKLLWRWRQGRFSR